MKGNDNIMQIQLKSKSSMQKDSNRKLFFAIFMLVYLSNGMFARMNIPASIRVIMIILLAFFFNKSKGFKIRLNRNAIVLTLTLFVLQAITCLVNGIYIEQDVFLFFSILSALLFCGALSFEEFIKGYRKVIYWISLISTLIYGINILFPTWINSVPDFLLQKGSSEGTFTLLWTFVIKRLSAQTYNRNFGIFIEPGQFQIFLCIGFIIEFFFCKKIQWKRIIVLGAALVTCRSTNGILAIIPIIIAYLLDSSKFEGKKRKYRRITIGVLIVIFGVIIVITENEYISSYVAEVVEKLQNMNISYSYEDVGTGLERRRSIDVAWKMFMANPIVGLGYKGWIIFKQELTSSDFIMTFSPLNWFARFGLVYGLITNLFYMSSFTFAPRKMVSRILVAVALFIIISTQEVTSDPFIWVLIFYGFANWLSKNKGENKWIDVVED